MTWHLFCVIIVNIEPSYLFLVFLLLIVCIFFIPGLVTFLEIRKEPAKFQRRLTVPQILFKAQYVCDFLILYKKNFRLNCTKFLFIHCSTQQKHTLKDTS